MDARERQQVQINWKTLHQMRSYKLNHQVKQSTDEAATMVGCLSPSFPVPHGSSMKLHLENQVWVVHQCCGILVLCHTAKNDHCQCYIAVSYIRLGILQLQVLKKTQILKIIDPCLHGNRDIFEEGDEQVDRP